MKAKRRLAREWAVQMLVAADLNPPDDVPSFMAGFWRQIVDLDDADGGPSVPPPGLREFAETRVAGVLGALKEIDGILAGLLDRWPVVINEAIDLANWFSSPRSRTLINGVLDRFAKGNP